MVFPLTVIEFQWPSSSLYLTLYCRTEHILSMGGSHLTGTVPPVTSLLLFTITGAPAKDRKYKHDYLNVFNSVEEKLTD